MEISVQQLCEKLGIKELTPMQSEVLKASENEGDIQLISPTGSGKTLGFLFAMLKNWDANATHTQSLIISPTRELAVQIDQVFRSLGVPFKALCIFGGHSLRTELQSMDPCPTLLIGTPGRILDHIDRESIDLSKLNSVIFDEFDKTLEMGFHDEVKAILDNLNAEKKIFSSATELKTFPDFIQLNNPQLQNYSHTNPEVEFFYHHYQREEEFAGLLESLCSFPEGKGIVFCNFRETVDNVVDFLSDSGIKAIGFHGAMEQDERMRAIIQFRNGTYPILVSTDLAARGLDIPAVETVVHFQLPPKEDAFIHRNGRTGRMDAAGRVIILLDKDMDEPAFIPEDKTRVKVPKNISLPDWPNVSTLYLSGGKKDKINKGDILGFLAKKGGLNGKEIGMINVLDRASYVAIPTDKIKHVLSNIHREKIKGQRLKIELSR